MTPGLARLAAAIAVAALVPAAAHSRDYGLAPVRIAADSYVFEGRREHFTAGNGGNIVNTGFIVTTAGVVVIDTGPSRLYGLEMRKAIAAITTRPPVRVFNSHLHPDHVFGNQAFPEVPVDSLPATIDGLRRTGAGYADNMYRLVGPWMGGTELRLPEREVAGSTVMIGNHRLELIPLAGHSGADLAIMDHESGVLWAGDMVFVDRAPTTPDADIAAWLAALDALERLPFTVLVPGHGPASRDGRAIAQTRDWLVWLTSTLAQAAEQGLDMTEAMALPIPSRFQSLALAREEFGRSVVHLYPSFEAAAMRRAN